MLSLLILVSRQKLVFQRDMAVSKMQWKLHIQVTNITKLEQIIFQHCVNCLELEHVEVILGVMCLQVVIF